MNSIESRFACAAEITGKAAQSALSLFRDRDNLAVEQKGLQDWVSNADKSVEDELRAALQEAFPQDAIIGEEHGLLAGESEFTWVIDPIDGTTNFVNGTPGWCVVLVCVQGDRSVCSIICDPVSNETFAAMRGHGATINGRAMKVSDATRLDEGTVAVGHSTRVPAQCTLNILEALMARNGLYRRGGSGALDLAYVAAGRSIGFVEPHMNSWDCLAALLMIEESGGVVEPFAMRSMLLNGGRVIASCRGIYDELAAMASRAYASD